MIDLKELRKLAEAASYKPGNQFIDVGAEQAFRAECQPSVVLSLFDRLEKYEQALVHIIGDYSGTGCSVCSDSQIESGKVISHLEDIATAALMSERSQ